MVQDARHLHQLTDGCMPPPMTPRTNIRLYADGDRAAVWGIFRATVAPGDTYVFDPEISEADALAYWLNPANCTFVAEREGRIVGSYILKANQPGLGSHVANAAFMVSPSARGSGVGRLMGEHCLAEAHKRGFRAMQFNFVVSTNHAAVRLWKELGFSIVGALPGAFAHRVHGFVDAYVMYRSIP
jgi:ribosomal protein S18 acetylase RimI-like enzyme